MIVNPIANAILYITEGDYTVVLPPPSSYSQNAPLVWDKAIGDTTTGYSVTGTYPWISVLFDLGTAMTAYQVECVWETSGASHGPNVWYWTGSTWIQLTSLSSSTGGSITTTQYTFTPTTARYFTVNVSGIVGGSQTAENFDCRLFVTSPINSFTGTWAGTCLSRNTIALSWSVDSGMQVSLDHGIGTIANTGSMNVTYDGNPTYTLTAYDSVAGTYTSPITVSQSIPSNMIVLPNVNKNVVYFNSGASYAAGVYLITCCGGAFKWDGTHIGVNANDRKAWSSQAFKVIGGQGVEIDAPGHYVGYGSLSTSDTYNTGLTQIINHQGGPIGIFLALDNYSTGSETTEYPAFAINGPAPTVSLTANSTPVIAGTNVTLSWSVNGSTDTGGISIDNGIGVVSSSGSTILSLSQTTRFNLTATYQGLTVTTYADVIIGSPSVPVAAITPQGSGNILLSWQTPSFTTVTMIERSSTGGGAGFSLIGYQFYGTNTYTDTVPLPGQTYYYRLRNYDGTNYSQYTTELSAASLTPPIVVDNLTVSAPYGTPILSWTASNTATSYQVKCSTRTGSEQTIATISVTGGSTINYTDLSAVNGVKTFYMVVGVNAQGNSAASNEVYIIPGTPTQTYTVI